jgi:P27 family predicted phage terminase small subunit
MGQRGFPPKPTVLELAQGRPGHRPINHLEPQPMACEPEMPRYLDREARREWKRLVPILLDMRVLSVADGIALANLCQAYSTLVAAQKAMQAMAKSGGSSLLVKNSIGKGENQRTMIRQSPLLRIINEQVEIINRLLREFGMTPAARPRLNIGESRNGQEALEQALCG